MEAIGRRAFLQTVGSFCIGFSFLGCTSGSNTPLDTAEPVAPLPDASRIDAWLKVLDDGRVQILTGKMDLGQGLTVAMQQVAGEELNLHPHQVEVVLADTGRTQDEGITAGSRSMERSAMIVRQAAAAAREGLLKLAADHWKVAADQLTIREGAVENNLNRKEVTFKTLLDGRQLTAKIPENVLLKPKDQYQWVGRPVPHPDLEKIIRGEAVHIQDLRFPEMVHARVVRPPVYGAQLTGWDRSVEIMPEVLKVVENGSFLGVIAAEEFAAVQAWEALQAKATWEMGPALPGVTSWADFMVEKSGKTATAHAAATHRAVYSKPYLMHGSIGPSCALAHFAEGRLHIWSHTQGVYPLRATISDLTGLAPENIRVTGVRGSGCYGHNGADDVAADVALLAMAFPGRHVRLQWQRHDEHRWEPYGSAMRMELAATLNKQGKIESWTYDLWSDTHSTRPRGDAGNLVSAHYLAKPVPLKTGNSVGGGTRNSEPYYAIPKVAVKDHYVAGPLRASALRSLGAFANIFAIECFMEELAEKAGQSPLDFRLVHSTDERAVAVLQKLKEITANQKTGPGEGFGFGFSRYKNTASYCAVAAKVLVDLAAKIVKPVKMWAVLEAGEAINPDGLINQTEGGMIQTASWTLKEEVKFDAAGITGKDWAGYPILRFDAVPETEVVILDRPDQPPLGAGEAAQGPAAAALANAVYAACGKRVRDLPLEKQLF